MDILFYHPTFDTAYWIEALSAALPGARVREWTQGDNEHADYALVWHPPVEMLRGPKAEGRFCPRGWRGLYPQQAEGAS